MDVSTTKPISKPITQGLGPQHLSIRQPLVPARSIRLVHFDITLPMTKNRLKSLLIAGDE